MQKYKVQQDCWIENQYRAKGDEIVMDEQVAKYEVMCGNLKKVEAAKAPAKTAAKAESK